MEDGTGLTSGGNGGSAEEVVAGVARLGVLFVNA